MSGHPAFLIVRAKLGEAARALHHMNAMHAQQGALQAGHPDLYSAAVHAESMVTNIQSVYTQFESILKTLANTVDGYSPSGDAWHRDLLLQASASDTDRPAMIGACTAEGMGELLKFRHAVRNVYASTLRHDEVFRNLAILQTVAPAFVSDIERFIDHSGANAQPPADPG